MENFLVWFEDLDRLNISILDKKKLLEEIREHTDFEYSVGETITVNGDNVYRCMYKETIENNNYHYFKKGIISYNFDY